MQARNRAKLQKQDVNLDTLLDQGESGAYEALQLYRSRALRAKSKSDNLSALQTTVEGAIKLVKKGYFAAGWQLCDQLLDFLNDMASDMSMPDIRELVFNVDDALVQAMDGEAEKKDDKESANSSFKVRRDFLKGAVKWSQAFGKQALGDTALHLRLGAASWTRDHRIATYHFVAGESPVQLAQKIDDSFSLEESETPKARKLAADRKCTLGVCQFLGLENLRDANELLVLYKKAQKNRGNAVDTKLLVFSAQLLELCRREKAAPLYKQLVNSCVDDLDGWGEGPGASTVTTLLQGPIAVRFFGMQPKVHPMMQMMQQFLN